MKPHAVFFCRNEESVKYVYTPEQIAEIGRLTDLRPGVFHEDALEKGELGDVELFFSTWGMPALTPEQLARLPKLKAVFYAAGATDGFARPLFAFTSTGIKEVVERMKKSASNVESSFL